MNSKDGLVMPLLGRHIMLLLSISMQKWEDGKFYSNVAMDGQTIYLLHTNFDLFS